MIVHRNVILGCAAGSEIKFGKRCVVSEAAYLCTSYAGKIHCGDDCSIGPFVKLFAHNLCEIGAGSHIESYCSIFAREHGLDGTLKVGRGCHIGDNSIVDLSGSVVLGDNVAVGPYSIIYTHDHDYQADSPAAWAGATLLGPVEIGDGAWVGSRVTILSGVKIGARAVVAAGAVVTKDVPPGVVVGGVPARPIKAQS
jgi:acetyltransferase-like isoleucine patch superfamily enzyme